MEPAESGPGRPTLLRSGATVYVLSRCPACQKIIAAINEALSGRDDFLATLEKNIASVLNVENGKTLTEMDDRLEVLQTQLLSWPAPRPTARM